MGTSEIENVRDYLFNNPTRNINCSTATRKYIMLNDDTIIVEGNLYRIVFKNLQGGVWNARLQTAYTSKTQIK